MPINKYYKGHGSEVMKNMKKEYGDKKGEEVFYATANKKGLKAEDMNEGTTAKPICPQCGRRIEQFAKTAKEAIKMCPKCKGKEKVNEMATPAPQTLIGAIKSQSWQNANEAFSGIMQQKVADALHSIKKTIFTEDYPHHGEGGNAAVEKMNKDVEDENERKDKEKLKSGRELETEDATKCSCGGSKKPNQVVCSSCMSKKYPKK